MFKCNFTHSIIERIQIWSIYGQQFRILEKGGGTKFWLQKPRYREVRVIERVKEYSGMPARGEATDLIQ